MNSEEIISALKEYGSFKGTISPNEPLAPKSTFKIGGKAELFVAPENLKSFQITLDVLNNFKVKYFIIGGGSNLVFPDNTFDGVIVSTHNFSEVNFLSKENLPLSMQNIQLRPEQVLITCFSGTTISSVVNFCTKNNLSGFEEFAGLPGTVGGALYMNARCFEKSISNLLFYSSYIDFSNQNTELKKINFIPEQWDYKKSPFQNHKYFITTATFLLEQKSIKEHNNIDQLCKKYISERVSKGHFKYPSAGSVFKNNHSFGKPSGKIIDEAGLKGYQIGGARIADFHGNFIINAGNATSTDVKALVEYAKKIVYEKFGFLLEPEIIFVD